MYRRHGYSTELLQEAIRNSDSWAGVARRLGLHADCGRYVKKRALVEIPSLDTRHFVGRGQRRYYTITDLKRAIHDSSSWAGVAVMLGLSPESHSWIREYAEIVITNLDTSHFLPDGRTLKQPTYTIEELQAAVIKYNSWNKVRKALGLKSPRSASTVRDHARSALPQLNTSHFVRPRGRAPGNKIKKIMVGA
jgi:hypothetical protein